MIIEKRIITDQEGGRHMIKLVYDCERGEMVQVIEGNGGHYAN